MIQATPKNTLNIQALIKPMMETHRTQANYSLEWRKENLYRMKTMLRDHSSEIIEALKKDLGEGPILAYSAQFMSVFEEIDYMLKNLKTLMKPKKVPFNPTFGPHLSQTRSVPLREPGVLIIGPSNYPLMLSLGPAAGSIAGGNPTVIKPSELCVHTSALLDKIVSETFDPSVLQVVQGGIPETTQLLEQEWGKICFTGSTRVGKIVAEAAAKTVTPVLMELGGKSPVYIDKDICNLSVVANRLVWAKFCNTGQTCIGPDYFLLHKDIADEFLDLAIKSTETQRWTHPDLSSLGRMVCVAHAERQKAMIVEAEQSPGATILMGGSEGCQPEDRYVQPTFVLNPPPDSRLMTEEIFGPIAVFQIVDSSEDAKNFINDMPGTPLAMYVCTSNDEVYEDMYRSCPSGSIVRNDAVIQGANSRLPFGGLGSSGYGSHHGKYSMEAFTHQRAEIRQPLFGHLGLRSFSLPQGMEKFLTSIETVPYGPVVPAKTLPAAMTLVLIWMMVPKAGLKQKVLMGVVSMLRTLAGVIANMV